jgi:hypothetical protein
MAFKFNPFTGTLDQTGSGGGASYIDGEVQNFSALPETIGTPAVDSAYLVREAEGTWLLARKPAGIYIRTADTGVRAADWTHASAFPDVFSDAAFTVFSDGDSTKNLQLSLSGITTGTTRTLTAPNKSGTIALTTDIPSVNDIELETDGTTTITTAQLPARGIAYAPEGESTYTVNLPTPDIRQSGLTFSLKTEYEEGSGTVFVTVVHAAVNLLTTYELDEDEGSIDFLWDGYAWTYDTAYRLRSFPGRVLQLPAASGTIARTEDFAAPPQIGSTTPNSGAFTTLNATGTTELVNGGTTAGPFRLYKTYTDASNYERLSLRWASNVAIIGTEKGSVGGSARALELQANGVTKIVIAATGNVTLRSADTSNGHIVNIDANTWRYSANGKTLNFGRDYGRAQSYFSADEFVFGTYANVSVSQTGQVVLTRDADNTLAQRNGANGQTFRIYNLAGTNFERANFRWESNEFIIDAEAGGSGTLHGIKLGSASTSLLGFFGATPVVQQGAVADATDAATAITQLNDLLARLRTLGLIAT